MFVSILSEGIYEIIQTPWNSWSAKSLSDIVKDVADAEALFLWEQNTAWYVEIKESGKVYDTILFHQTLQLIKMAFSMHVHAVVIKIWANIHVIVWYAVYLFSIIVPGMDRMVKRTNVI